jgi:hypothetical protein
VNNVLHQAGEFNGGPSRAEMQLLLAAVAAFERHADVTVKRQTTTRAERFGDELHAVRLCPALRADESFIRARWFIFANLANLRVKERRESVEDAGQSWKTAGAIGHRFSFSAGSA